MSSKNALKIILDFGKTLMTNTNSSELLKRVDKIEAGTNRVPPNVVEALAIQFRKQPTYEKVAELLQGMSLQSGTRVYRPTILNACLKALRSSLIESAQDFEDSLIKVREQNRFLGRRLPRKAVGSTLLLKGLEADAVVIVDADLLDARNLYVAMTRGSKLLVVCSRESILSPK